MSVTLNRAERLRRCYFHEEIDRPAVYSRTNFPPNDPSYDRLKEYLAERSELKVAWSSSCVESTFRVDMHEEPHSEEFERRIHILHTPMGDLRSSTFVSLKGQPEMAEEFFIKSPEDAEMYLSLPMPALGGDVSSFFSALKRMDDRGIVDVSLGLNPAGYVVELLGSETFAMMSVSDRDVLHRLCEQRKEVLLERLRFLLSRGVGPFFSLAGAEYVVPPMHGPKDFFDFNVQYDTPIIDLIHEAGGRMHVHCHGSIKKVFSGFVEMGADVLHPFEAPPMGDITPREAKDSARDRMCLEGNIQINRMYEASPEEIREETEALIRDIFDDGKGLIVSPSASPYIRGAGEQCFPQYKAMVDTVAEWKG